MGLLSATKAVFSLEFGKAADLLFVPEETIEEGKDVDRRIADFNASAPQDKQIPGRTIEQVISDNSPSEAFVEGAKEGLSNSVKAIQNVTGGGLVAAISSLRYVILAAVVCFAIYLWVKKKL